jgi:hypothetical protein
MESKDIAEKPVKAKATKSFIIKELPLSVHKKILKHQLNITGKPRIEDSAISLMLAGYEKLYSNQ